MEVGSFRKTNKVDELVIFWACLAPDLSNHALQSPLQSVEETCTNYNQTNCSARLVLSWVSLWTQKRKAYLECIMPFRIMHLKSTWQCSIFGFFCLLKQGCLHHSTFVMHFCCALFLLYTIVHLISVWFFWGSILWYSQSGKSSTRQFSQICIWTRYYEII